MTWAPPITLRLRPSKIAIQFFIPMQVYIMSQVLLTPEQVKRWQSFLSIVRKKFSEVQIRPNISVG